MTRKRGGPFGAVPTRAIFDQEVTAAQLRVLAAVSSYADEGGWCWPEVATIAERLGITDRSVRRHLQVLRDRGYVEARQRFRRGGMQASNHWRVLYDGREDPPDFVDDSAPVIAADLAPVAERPGRNDAPDAERHPRNGAPDGERPGRNGAPDSQRQTGPDAERHPGPDAERHPVDEQTTEQTTGNTRAPDSAAPPQPRPPAWARGMAGPQGVSHSMVATELVGEYAAACKASPPTRWLDLLHTEVMGMLADGQPRELIAAGMARLRKRALPPRMLDHMIADVVGAEPARGAADDRQVTAPYVPSWARDDHVETDAGLAHVHELRQRLRPSGGDPA